MKIIRTYNTYIEAHIAYGQLAENGIESFLQDEFTVTIDPVLTNAVGGIKLTVRDEDADQANEILFAFEADRKEKQACPNCGSTDVEYIVTDAPKNWLMAVVSFSLSSMPVSAEKKYHCFHCGFEFSEIDSNENSE